MHLTYTTLTYKFLFQIFATADDFFLKKSLIHRENELPTMPSHLLNLLLDPHFLIVDAESVYMGYVPRTYMFRWWHIDTTVIFRTMRKSPPISAILPESIHEKFGLVRKIVISHWRPVISS
jgi:hypothetical protein